eukprot:11209131-Lingulodinium_polyedra.AAC.1
MEFVHPDCLPPPAEAIPVWAALGLPVGSLSEVAEEWRLLWTGEKLLVPSKYEGDASTIEKVSDVITSCLSIHKHTETRWLTIGKSC